MTSDERKGYVGKVAFVTGAASGIGRATALAFARERASVVAADISEQGSRETARMIEESGGRTLAVKCDVSQVEDVKSALNNTIEMFGRLDIGFNNAGVEQPIMATADITENEWDRILDINLRGVFLCMRHEARDPLDAQGKGRRDSQHLLRSRGQRLRGSGRLLCR